MTRKRKQLLIAGILLVLSLVAVAAGWRYLPFNKLLKVSGSPEEAFTNPQQIREQPPNTLYFDFEVPHGKETPAGFYQGIAHSGLYAVKAFGQNSYSVAIERKASEIGIPNLKSVAVSAWVYVKPTKNDVTAALVLAVSNELGVNVSWQAVALREPLVPREKWFKISGNFDLSSVKFSPDYKIQVYFWNNSRTDILVDDYFISFGGAPERHGDSTRVDLTGGNGFHPEFNRPPYPIRFLEKQPASKMIPPADIGPEDKVISGNFLPDGSEELLILKGNTKADLWSWCTGNNEFRKISLSLPQTMATVGKIDRIHKGRFIVGETDQFIVVGDKGYLLCAIDRAADPCKEEKPVAAAVKVLSHTKEIVHLLVSGDFNGDRNTGLLTVSGNGTWKISRFQPAPGGGDWKILTTGSTPVKEWVRGDYETALTAGRFRSGSIDHLLAVSKDKKGLSAWTLLRLNPGTLRWEPVYRERGGLRAENSDLYTGYTIGPDTLKPDDLFFTSVCPSNAQPPAVFRYSRDWRFDLKEIRFNDSTYQVLQNIDFRGFTGSQNPKYYESLLMLPGNFNGQPGFLVSGKIAKERNYGKILPDFTDIYVFPKTPSK
jgi:hypothetical protein